MAPSHLTSERLTQVLSMLAVCLLAGISRSDEWMTWPSTYTHDQQGRAVDQFALPQPPQAPDRSDFVRSGFRHFRSTLQVGQSADNFHVVEQWGAPIAPYEAWRFPFRPYGVPYDQWGPPVGFGFGGWPGFAPGWGGGWGNGGMGNGGWIQGGQVPGTGPLPPVFPGVRPIFPIQPSYEGQPWFDGTYPSAPPLDPRSDEEFFYRPPRLGSQP